MYVKFTKIAVELRDEPMMTYLLNAAFFFYKKPRLKCRQYPLFAILSVRSSGDQTVNTHTETQNNYSNPHAYAH